MTPPSQRGERAKRVELWECCACGHIDTEGHACPKLNGLTSANGREWSEFPKVAEAAATEVGA